VGGTEAGAAGPVAGGGPPGLLPRDHRCLARAGQAGAKQPKSRPEPPACAVQALIAHTRDDAGTWQKAADAFAAVVRDGTDHGDAAFGRAGFLLGCALLLEAAPAAGDTRALRSLGDELASALASTALVPAGRRMAAQMVAPDFFARAADGTGLVVDCRPADRIDVRPAVAFAAMRRACERLGWVYRLVGEIDAVRVANLRWLAGYRHPRYGESAGLNAAVTASFAVPAPLVAQVASVGDPLQVLPVVFHLLWCGCLTADLSCPLIDRTLVSRSEER
jgi:hypothetical protein